MNEDQFQGATCNLMPNLERDVTINNDDYFKSYEDLEIQRLMVADRARTEAYRDAILGNKHLFEGNIVMDVGAGTGVLSLFMAKAGAKKVYAVEASALATMIPAIAKENGFSEVIEAFHCRVEDFKLPSEQKVDVIVSEWMGFYLLHESMLSSVIYARNNFLSDEGTIFPSEARLYACPCSLDGLYEEQFYFWDNVYGFNMSEVKNKAFQSKSTKPEVYKVNSSDLLSEPVCIKTFHLRYVVEEEVADFSCTNFVGISKSGNFHGLALWFSVDFDGRSYDSEGDEYGTLVSLSTSPFSQLTHWKQTVIVFGKLKNLRSPESMEDVEMPLPRLSRLESLSSDCQVDDGIENDEYDQGPVVEEDEVVGWKLEFKRCSDNLRHYTMTVEMLDPEDSEHPIPCVCPMPRCLIIAKMIEKDDHSLEESLGDGETE